MAVYTEGRGKREYPFGLDELKVEKPHGNGREETKEEGRE
jgi:hypothetical protein